MDKEKRINDKKFKQFYNEQQKRKVIRDFLKEKRSSLEWEQLMEVLKNKKD